MGGHFWSLDQDQRPVIRIAHALQKHGSCYRSDRRASFIHAQVARNGVATFAPDASGQQFQAVMPQSRDARCAIDELPYALPHHGWLNPCRLRGDQPVDVGVATGLGSVADIELAVDVR